MTDVRPDRATALEAELGDPEAEGSAVGYAAILRADERGEPLEAGEETLRRLGFDAEFVPASLGGRLRGIDQLARILRPVFRRDPALGLGYGLTTFMAGVNVWAAGDARQRRELAATILGAGRAAVCYHELEHGNDVVGNDFRAERDGDRLLLTGEKNVINNVGRAAALVLFARTDPAPGSRSHSVLLIDPRRVTGGVWQSLPRYRASGVRGCVLGGIRAERAAVEADCVVGGLGGGLEIALRSFQVTRAALPAAAVAAGDTALRTTLDFAVHRTLYGTRVARLPQATEVLAGAFADLLLCDALSGVASRALHLLPGQAGVLSAATKDLVPALLTEMLYELSVLLGARGYLREGRHAIFQKIARDLPVLSAGHAGGAICQAGVLIQVRSLALRGWQSPEPLPPALGRVGADLDELCFDRFSLTSNGRDDLVGGLPDACAGLLRAEPGVGTAVLVAALLRERDALHDEAAALPPLDRTSFGQAAGFALARRYALLAAAAASLAVWRAHRDDPEAFLGRPLWIRAVLGRVVGRLRGDRTPGPAELSAGLMAELVSRHEQRRSFDLYRDPLYSTAHKSEIGTLP